MYEMKTKESPRKQQKQAAQAGNIAVHKLVRLVLRHKTLERSVSWEDVIQTAKGVTLVDSSAATNLLEEVREFDQPGLKRHVTPVRGDPN